MDIYFDNAATTITSENVIRYCNDKMVSYYANPSSFHLKGLEVEKAIRNTKECIGKYLNASPSEIYFTSGGTESNNLAILGTVNINAKKTIITTKSQHSSVVEPIKYLKDKGVDVIYLDFKDGKINYLELEKAVDKNTTLISLPHVNNETGAILDLKKTSSIIKSKNEKAIFHVDGVQSFGKIKTNVQSIDIFTFSSHKIHGLKGVGGLYIKKNTNIKPIFYGGNQQNKIRPGTENTYGIISLFQATKEAFLNIEENYNHVKMLKEKLSHITKIIDNSFINGGLENTSPYILNISFMDVKGEVLLNELSNKNIFVSTASACSGKKISENLLSQGFDEKRVTNAIRFSFSKYNTLKEVEYCIDVLKSLSYWRQ